MDLDLSLKKKYSRDLYLPWLQYLKDFGDYVEVRGRTTLELLNGVSIVSEPWHSCILIPTRKWNPWLAMSEALWILAGRDDVAALKPYNKNIVNYSDDDETLYGAYGPRIYDQIDPLIRRLEKDPSDRRAVLGIWDPFGNQDPYIDPWDDLNTDSKDPPCNNLIYFKLRHNRLHMTVICRSNDLHWGLFAVNLPTFGILQQYIAARLGVDVGTQTHLSNSLHIYTDDKAATDITERMLYGSEDLPKYPEHAMAFTKEDFHSTPNMDHVTLASMCNIALDEEPTSEDWPPFLQFASQFLRCYRQKKWDQTWETKNPKYNFREMYADWLMAGSMFVGKEL